jgi:hypothetical protein
MVVVFGHEVKMVYQTKGLLQARMQKRLRELCRFQSF